MKQHVDFVSGPHHHGWHFVAGLLVGALFGHRLGSWLFDNQILTWTATAAAAVGLAIFCGRWGEPAWQWVGDRLSNRWWW